jgi:hypothetical protein
MFVKIKCLYITRYSVENVIRFADEFVEVCRSLLPGQRQDRAMVGTARGRGKYL